MILNLKFEVKQHKTVFGKKTGRLSVMMGEEEIFADNKEELAVKCQEWIERVSRRPQIGYAKAGDEFMIAVHHNDCTLTYRSHEDNPPDGVVMLRSTSHSGWDVKNETELNALHLLKCQWKLGDGIPDGCPERLKGEFASWIKFQEEYAAQHSS